MLFKKIWDNDFYNLIVENADNWDNIQEEILCGFNPFFDIE
jgi:hypothetical protein